MPYQMITLDPPWPERGGGGRGAQNHYPVITKKETILEVILGSGVFKPHENCHMIMWTSNNYVPWAIWLIANLGFEYKTMVTWPKEVRGTGFYFAGKTEHFIFATRGTLWPREKAKYTTLMDVAHDPSNDANSHSRKPDEIYDIAESIGYGPRLEMFARHDPRPGWDKWGRDMIDPETKQSLPEAHVLRTSESGLTSVVRPD